MNTPIYNNFGKACFSYYALTNIKSTLVNILNLCTKEILTKLCLALNIPIVKTFLFLECTL